MSGARTLRRGRTGNESIMRQRTGTKSGVAMVGLLGTLTACNGALVLSFEPDSGAPGGATGCAAGSCTSSPDARSTPMLGREADAACPAPSNWLPTTPAVAMTNYAPHPDTECPFYQGAYQNFLIAAQPDSSGDPAFFQYATIDDAFASTLPHAQRDTSGRAWLIAVLQAGERDVLIDRDDHAIYYGVHMNQAFADFIESNHLDTVSGILGVDPSLSFPPGLVEIQTAWKDIDPQDFPDSSGAYGTPNGVVPPPTSFASDPGDYSNYITTTAWLPLLSKSTVGLIVEDANQPLLRRIALVGMNIAYTLPGHPEFIWASVQHVNALEVDPLPLALSGIRVLGMPDTQPNAVDADGGLALPTLGDPQNVDISAPPDPQNDYLLYTHGTPENDCLTLVPSNQLTFNASQQSFPGGASNVYRMFPGSRSTALGLPDSMASFNANVANLWATATAQGTVAAGDERKNYRLVGALWLDKPYFFGTNYPGVPIPAGDPAQGAGVWFQNDDGTNPLVVGVCGTGVACIPPNPINLYPNVSEGVSCGTPLDSTDTSGDSPNASPSNNSVPGCITRADLIQEGDDPQTDYYTASPEAGTTDPFSILGGADRLSSTSLNSFTENNTFRNCFACHNTMPTDTNGVSYNPNNPGGALPILSKPANINVSHLFSEFIFRDAEEVCGATTIPCPGQLPDAGH